MQPDVQEVEGRARLDKAMASYRRYLDETPRDAMTPEAMRRLADLQIEKEFGLAPATASLGEMAAPERASRRRRRRRSHGGRDRRRRSPPNPTRSSSGARPAQTDIATAADAAAMAPAAPASSRSPAGPLEAIALYDQLLAEYPNYEHNDQVLYQKARAYDELGRTDEAMETMERLIRANPHSRHDDEVQFRRAEYFFTRRKFREAETPTPAIIGLGAGVAYYELALYKLGWTLYKQDFYEEALHQYMALLDYKVSIGYDFDQKHEEDDERRVADTFRVISLSFSTSAGPRSCRSTSRLGHAATRTASTATSASTTSPSCATTMPRRPTRRSSRSIRSTARRRASACA